MDTRYGQSLDIGKLLGAEDNSVDKKPVVVEETKEDKPASVSKNSAPFLSDKNLVRVMLFFLIISSIVVLVQPQNLDRIDSNVRKSVVAQYEQLAIADVLKEFPDVSVQQKRAFVDKKVYEMMQHPEFEQRVAAVSEHYKYFYRDESGQTLLYSADPYYYFRLARNLAEKGMIGDKKISNREYPLVIEDMDELRFFPFGDRVTLNVLPHVLLIFFRVVSGVFPFVSLLTSTFYFPVFAGVFSVVLMFLIGKKISGIGAGFFGSIVFLLHPIFLFWNYAGYADTHVLAMTVSLASVLLFLYGIDFSHKIRAMFSWFVFFVILYHSELFWSGLLFFPVLFVTSLIFFIIIWLIRMSRNNKKYLFLTVNLVSIMVLFLIFYGALNYEHLVVMVQRLLILLNLVPVNEVFPTAFSVITELEGAKNLSRFVTALGGGLLVFIVFIELLFFVKNLKDKFEIKTLLPWVWFALFIIPAFLSARFLFFLAPPLALIVGKSFARINFLFEQLVGLVLKLRLSSDVIKFSSLIVTSFIIFLIINPSPFVAKTKLPLVTKSLVDAAEFVRSHSEKDTVIATSFDLGYAWQAFSRRATFFDGGLFKTSREYWTSRVIMSKNETETETILHILRCGNDVHAINSVAKWVATNDYRNCARKNQVVIAITESMLYQMYLYDYYVNWDFKAAQLRQDVSGRSFENATSFLQSAYNLSEESTLEAYYAAKSFEEVIPPKHVGEIAHCKKNDKMIVCNDGLTVMLPSLNATIEGVYPKSLVFVKDGKRTVVQFKNSKETFSAVVYESGSEFRSILMDTELVDTMLVRMFTGENLSLFESVFISAEKPDRVVVYKMKS